MNTIFNRREALMRAGGGLGWLACAALLDKAGWRAQAASGNPLAPKRPPLQPRAKSVIWIFANGGPSQVDTWDYKPELQKRDGQTLDGFDPKTGFFPGSAGALMKSPFEWGQHGVSGSWGSDLFPHLNRHVDKMAFIHSCWTGSNNHSPALFMMNTGITRMGSPCVGSWVTYGLGSEAESLPSFVVMSDPLNRGLPKGNALNWGAGFLPSVYQGTWLKPSGEPIENLQPAPEQAGGIQRAQLDLLGRLNRRRLAESPIESELSARIESFELAYRMQTAAPEAFAIQEEPEHVKTAYGIGTKHCGHFGAQCLMARRMVERGVRFINIYNEGWDAHSDVAGNVTKNCGITDQASAALIKDLKQRGMLDDTLVVWGGEFGRTPMVEASLSLGRSMGRDHHPQAFSMWMAGGGIKGGVTIGATDEMGFNIVEDEVKVADLQATILHCLGIDHEHLTFRSAGLDFKLTGVEPCQVVKKILA